jgi:hypothetical protein
VVFALLSAGEQNPVRPDIKIQGETTMTRFVLTMILIATSTLVGTNRAVAASIPIVPDARAGVTSTSVSDTDFLNFKRADNSSHLDPDPFPRRLEVAQVPIASACYTFAGPICPMVVAVPVGAPCHCGTLSGIAY